MQEIKTEPDWLPDPSVDFSASCLVTLMFINSGKDLNRQERIHVDTRTGTIESSVATTEERIFDITLDDVFSIEVEKIYVTVERGSKGNGTYRWKRTIPAHYQLNVEIKCLDHSDAKQLLGLMEMKSAAKYRNSLTEEDATLRATWYDLPECPPPGKLLTMTRTDGHRHPANMKFGVELSMGWSRKKDPPLMIHAKKRRAALIPDQVQLPTPSASDDSGDVVKHYHITYVFMDKRFHKMENLHCPFCATAPSARAQQNFTSFDRLHTHMLLWHDHFHPRVEMTGHHHAQGISTFEYTVHLTLSPTHTERIVQPKRPGDEDCWIAPERPFDEKAYLRGEDNWTGHNLKRLERPQLNATKKQLSSGPAPSKAARPALPEINDLPEIRKERWKIPQVPRVRFYRTKSKRPFEADEEVSESDESVDENWLQAHKRDDMSSLPISEGGREFYQDWNFAAKEDDFPADLFIRECLVRFARKFSGKMWDNEYYAEFMKMVDRLLALKFIDSEVRDYCSDCRSFSSDMPNRSVGGKRLRGIEDMSHGRQKKKASDPHPDEQGGNTCSCGSLVESARAAVTCHNIVSIHHPSLST